MNVYHNEIKSKPLQKYLKIVSISVCILSIYNTIEVRMHVFVQYTVCALIEKILKVICDMSVCVSISSGIANRLAKSSWLDTFF